MMRFVVGTMLVLAVNAVAHPVPGYLEWDKDEEGKGSIRVTLALSCWSELVHLDSNLDGTVDRGEIADALPRLRDKLTGLVQPRLQGKVASLGVVTGVQTLWPADVAAGTGTFTLDACYLDMTFAPEVDSGGIEFDFSALLERIKSLETLEVEYDADGGTLKAVAGREQPKLRLE